MSCPCGSGLPHESCCGPCLSGARPAATAEALMRARYTAHVFGDVDYIARTLAPESQAGFDRCAVLDWATRSQWLGLRIVATERGALSDDEGVVEFVATYRRDGRVQDHRERSLFRKTGAGEWLFVRGGPPPPRQAARNDPCPCGSGRKFKKCCGA